ncbi:MAG: hypothetical protein Q8M29_12170 [Bacteroidota bacterium]|nr:hypothetical protein [Bacteroidota bacterium]
MKINFFFFIIFITILDAKAQTNVTPSSNAMLFIQDKTIYYYNTELMNDPKNYEVVKVIDPSQETLEKNGTALCIHSNDYLEGIAYTNGYFINDKKSISKYSDLKVKSYGVKISAFTDPFADEVYIFDHYGKTGKWETLQLRGDVNDNTKVENFGDGCLIYDFDADYLFGFSSGKENTFNKYDKSDFKSNDYKVIASNQKCVILFSDADDMLIAFSAIKNQWYHFPFSSGGIQDCNGMQGSDNLLISSQSADKAFLFNPNSNVGFLQINGLGSNNFSWTN